MNIEKKATEIIEQILHQPAEPVANIELKLSKVQFVELCSYILQYYGGRTGHEFLLKFHRSFIKLTVSELREMINEMTYKKEFGVHTLLGFYVQYTYVCDDELLHSLGVTDKSFSTAPKPEALADNILLNRTLKKLTLSDEEIDTIRSMKPIFEVVV